MNFVENYRWNEDGTSALSRPERSEDWTLGVFCFLPSLRKMGRNSSGGRVLWADRSGAKIEPLGSSLLPLRSTKKRQDIMSCLFFVNQCGRWDLNPHERNAHKILSLARLPVPTLPLTTSKSWNTVLSWSILFRFLDARHSISEKNNLVNTFFQKNLIIFWPIFEGKKLHFKHLDYTVQLYYFI